MKLIHRVCLLGATFLFAATAAAQTFPDRPLRLVVPFPPGGGTDIIARELALAINRTSGWSVVAENRPGAGGNLGVDAIAKSTPDGYSLVLGQTSNLAINPTLYRGIQYDPLKDLRPVALVATAPLALVVSANSPYKTLADLIDAAKAKPGVLNFASSGNGTVAHLTGEQLQQAASVKFEHVPYKGANQALNDLIGGQIQLFMASVPTALGQVRTGKLRALAVTSAERVAELPEVPTVKESGYAGFDANTWFGLMVPAGTPDAVVATLNAAANKAMSTPEFENRIVSEGGKVLGGTPEQFTTRLVHDQKVWGEVIKTSGVTLD